MRLIIAFGAGLIFGVGIVISGMGNPAKVLNFFDITGSWDPSLMFVMGGALTVAFVGYSFTFKRSGPIFDKNFPQFKTSIDRRLVFGAAVFGLGWGIAGFCPGGSLPMIGTGRVEVLMFVGALIAGILFTRLFLLKLFEKAEKHYG